MSEVLSFVADRVVADVTEFTPGCVVHLIAFGTGNPDAGGHAWNFSRASVDDWGVCTEREIQQATIYEGIASFVLGRNDARCIFEPRAALEAKCKELQIAFAIDDHRWKSLVEVAKVVFKGRKYFTVAGSA